MGNKDTAFIIGNASSREGIDITGRRKFGKTFGCNEIFREGVVDFLGALDRAMMQQIIKDGYHKRHKAFGYNKVGIEPQDAKLIKPLPPTGPANTGAAMLMLAVEMGFKSIYLVGFDLSTSAWADQVFQTIWNHPEVEFTVSDPSEVWERWIKKVTN